jgi:hypothetical protein
MEEGHWRNHPRNLRLENHEEQEQPRLLCDDACFEAR